MNLHKILNGSLRTIILLLTYKIILKIAVLRRADLCLVFLLERNLFLFKLSSFEIID